MTEKTPDCKEKFLHQKLADIGVRIFKMDLFYPFEECYWIHAQKTTEEWREDIRNFIAQGEVTATGDPWTAADKIALSLSNYLGNLGYCELEDVTSDVYEGQIAATSAKLQPSPLTESEDGFGHYGWEAKIKKTYKLT